MASWSVRQGGMTVASGSAPDVATAHREVFRYAIQYAADGDVEFAVRDGRKVVIRGKAPGPKLSETPNG